jgi:vancomycin resistance protein YoaR
MAVTSATEARPSVSLRGRLFGRPVRLTVLLLLVLALGAVAAALAFDRAYQGRVLPGVSVAGVDVSGLTAAELEARVAQIQIVPPSLAVTSGGRMVKVDAATLGASVDVDGAVAAALATGRAPGPLANVPDRFVLMRDGHDIPLTASIDRQALWAWVTARADQLRIAPRNAVIVNSPSGWVSTTARTGRALDVTAAAGILETALTGDGAASTTVELPIRTIQPDVDRLDAVLAISAAERMALPLNLTFRDGRRWTIPSATIRAAITFAPGGDRPTPILDSSIVAAAIAPLSEEIDNKPTESLLLKTKSGAVFGYVPGKGGRALDVQGNAREAARVIAARGSGDLNAAAGVRLQTTDRAPELTAEEAAKFGPQVKRVGAWTTKFVPSEKNFFGANIRLPARFINGTVVQPGQVFDFWQVVGPVTFSRGFGMGGFIEAGRTNPTGAIGGGICSASTTMFNAAARAGYQILERDNHAYYIARYPLGLDATVSKFGGRISQNMRFRNDTGNALLIRGLSGSTWVRFEIFSVPNGRTVTFSSPSVSNVRQAIDTRVETTELKRGQTERTETPSDGKNVVVTRTVRDSGGRVIHSDRWVSNYVRVDGVLRVGIG